MAESTKAVFISYASQDAPAATRICEALRAAGIEVWFDQSELRGGDAWDAAIRKQIRTCALFIPVISTNTVARVEGYFRLEWKLAVDRSHLMSHDLPFLLPVVIDHVDEAEDRVPERFKEVQWTRMIDGVIPSTFANRVAQLLSVDASARQSTRPAQKVSSVEAPRKPKLIIIASVVFGMAIFAGGWILLRRSASTKPAAVSPANVDAGLHATPRAIPESSIAVLAFTDMSQTRDQEYFSDGLSEELINQLSRIAALRVPARTSSFYFKGRADDIATIASKLRVTYVLEGSVRKIGDRLRVTANLIRADNGYHVWAETFDLKLKDVFTVQDEIATAVVTALKLKLAPGQSIASQLTANAEAYNKYLLARQFYSRGDADGYQRAIEASRKAIALDPNFGAAYADLASALFSLADFNGDAGGFELAIEAATTAVVLAPNGASGYAVRGFIRSNHTWDWDGAEADYNKALALEPGDAEVRNDYGQLLQSLGRLPDAIRSARNATDLNPLSGPAWENLTRFLIDHGDYGEANAAAARALEISPESMFALNNLGTLQLLQRQAAAALQTFRKIGFEGFRQQGVALAEHTLGNDHDSQLALDDLSNKHAQDGRYEIAEIYAWRGERDKAFEWLEHAYQARDGGLANLKSDPLLASLRADSRFAALLSKVKLPP